MAKYEYALNQITPESIMKALSSIKKGKIYDLGVAMSIDMPMGSRKTFDSFSLFQYRLPQSLINPDAKGFDFAMDSINVSPHLGTHLDCFPHIYKDDHTFGGLKPIDIITPYGWSQYGAETVPPVIARGVLIDVAGYLGVDIVPDDVHIDENMLADCVEKLGVELRQGDVVCINTGKIAQYYAGDEAYITSQCGIVGSGAAWLYDRGMIMLGTDTSATDPIPMVENNWTHVEMLVERGVHVVEWLDLLQLAKDKVKEFTFIGSCVKVKGASGAWINPIALV